MFFSFFHSLLYPLQLRVYLARVIRNLSEGKLLKKTKNAKHLSVRERARVRVGASVCMREKERQSWSVRAAGNVPITFSK